MPSGVDCPRSVSMQPTQRTGPDLEVQTTSLAATPQFCWKHNTKGTELETLTALICGPLESVLLWCPNSFTSRIAYESTQCRLQHKGQILSSPFMYIRLYESHSLGNRTAIVMPRLCHCTLFYTLTMPFSLRSAIRQLLLLRYRATVGCFLCGERSADTFHNDFIFTELPN